MQKIDACDLEKAQNGDSQALERLLTQNSALIYSIVRRYTGRGTETEDLFQIGSIGFIKAVRGFSGEYGTQFSTYAVPKIAGEIKRFLRDDGMVKVSRDIRENGIKINAASAAFEKEHGREPRISELCGETGLSPEDVALCVGSQTQISSLDAEISEDFRLMDTLESPDFEPQVLEKMSLHTALGRLPEVQRRLLDLRYFRGLSQQKTAEILRLSQVQVSRMERKACVMLKELLLT